MIIDTEVLRARISQYLKDKNDNSDAKSIEWFLHEDVRAELECLMDDLFTQIPYPLRYHIISMPKDHVFSGFEVNDSAEGKPVRSPQFDDGLELTAWKDCRCIENDGIFAQFPRKYFNTCDGANATGCIVKNNNGMFGLFKPLYDGMGGGVRCFLSREDCNFPYEDIRIQSRSNGFWGMDCLVYVKKNGLWGVIDMSFDKELTVLVNSEFNTINEASAQLGLDLVSFDEFENGIYFGPGQ